MALAVLLRDPEENPVALSRRPSAPGPGRRTAGGPAVSPAGPGAAPTPVPARLQKWQGLMLPWGHTTSGRRRAPCCLQAHEWPVAPERPQEKEKKIKKGLLSYFYNCQDRFWGRAAARLAEARG